MEVDQELLGARSNDPPGDAVPADIDETGALW